MTFQSPARLFDLFRLLRNVVNNDAAAHQLGQKKAFVYRISRNHRHVLWARVLVESS